MSKLSFRARALDASKPMAIYMAEELPDLPDFSAINRAVPQMPSGMQKEEECEHHLQRAIVAGLIIPTPEVSELPNREFYEKVYPANYKQPRQLIHMQRKKKKNNKKYKKIPLKKRLAMRKELMPIVVPAVLPTGSEQIIIRSTFTMEQDIPDYDMDSDDERWLQSQTQKLDLNPMKFEEMMDRLEKSSGQTVVTLNEAKALLKEDDDLIIAVFDYWLNKRLKTQHPLILTVKTEHRSGTAANNPYLAFRRRTEKMQTRKNRKNDEASYEKMLKLRRDLYRAVTLLELVKRREKIKREFAHLTIEVFEKRYQARDFNGAILAEASAVKSTRPAFTPIFHNHYTNQTWSNKAILKDEVLPRREKRQYKKRKHKSLGTGRSGSMGASGLETMGGLSSDEESTIPQLSPETEEVEDEGKFAFRRNKSCSYHMPLPYQGNWPWCSKEEHGLADKRFRFALTSISNPRRCIGFARRRVGRGGRIILDRMSTTDDDFWRKLNYSVYETSGSSNVMTGIRGSSYSNSDVKNEGGSSVVGVRTSENVGNGVDVEIKTENIKVEPPSEPVLTKEEQEEMVECMSSSIGKDWLHFRPKTPPLDYEPPCDMLLSQDTFFNPSANMPFSMEIQALEVSSGTLLDTVSSIYVTDPFLFEPDTPVTDTRQQNTLTFPSVSSSNNNNNNNDGSGGSSYNDRGGSGNCDDEYSESSNRTIGCSNFRVVCATDEMTTTANPPTTATNKQDKSGIVVSCSSFSASSLSSSGTSTSPKLNSVNVASVVASSADDKHAAASGGHRAAGNAEGSIGNTNGLLAQFGLEVPSNKSRNNKLSYAYSGAVAYPKASSGTLSLHTSAHTLTLNSHSANILDLPITDDEDGSKLNADSTSATVPTNNKTKTIVRKNNIIMEVT